jgi:hypothetical protein
MSEEKIRSLSYFAEDGSYGDASGILVMETTHFSELDWQMLQDCSDEQRTTVARLIVESYEPEADQKFIREKLEEFGFDFSDYELS